MSTVNRVVISIVWYVLGFALARLLEYPIRLLLIYPLAHLFLLLALVPSEAREGIDKIAQVYWMEYISFIKQPFYWILWLGSGTLAGCVAAIDEGNRWGISPRILRAFATAFILLSIYGCIILFRGLPYELAAMNFIGLPAFITAQFYVGVLLARWLPRVYDLLEKTQIRVRW